MSEYKTESEKRKHRVCFTGHRPWKIPVSEFTLREIVSRSIAQAISEGYTTFISGMAQGFDTVAAETVLEYRKSNASIHLICAVPYPAFDHSWNQHWHARCQHVISNADLVLSISPEYTPHCYQSRNEWMVQHSSLVIALYLNIPSGTKNTIDYAKSIGVEVKQLRITEQTK